MGTILSLRGCVCLLSCFSHVLLFAPPQTVACQAPLSMEFSSQEYQNGLLFPLPGDLPYPGIELWSPALKADSLLSVPPRKPSYMQRITLFKVSFPVQKFLSLIRWHLFLFLFSLLQVVGQKRPFCDLCQGVFCLCFPLRVFFFFFPILSGLTFRSLIHFEFIFVDGVRDCSNFILLYVTTQFLQHHLLKRWSLLHCIFWSPLSQIR